MIKQNVNTQYGQLFKLQTVMYIFAIFFTLCEIWNIVKINSTAVWLTIVSQELSLLGLDPIEGKQPFAFNILTLFTTLTNCMAYFIIAIVAMQTR